MTLLTLDIRCTRCGAKPNTRIFPKTREKYLGEADDEPVETWGCRCGEKILVTAKAYKGAA
jgi:hypothetical protein